jgi:hypothetical protein
VTDDAAPEPTLEGTFSPPTAFADEATAGFSGRGAVTLTAAGLRLQGRWASRSRRLAAVLGGFGVSLVAGFTLLAADLPSASPLGFVTPMAGAWIYVRQRLGPRDFDAVIPWAWVGNPGVSQGALLFELLGEPKGTVRFVAAGADFATLRRVAQAMRRAAGLG